MKVKALLYVGLLIALSGCTGMGVKNEPSSNNEQAFKHLTKNHSIAENHYLIKGKSAQHTKRMMAWINISKN
jgi:hypothetical protein